MKDFPLWIQLILGFASTGMGIYFLKRYVSKNDEFQKEVEKNLKEINMSITDFKLVANQVSHQLEFYKKVLSLDFEKIREDVKKVNKEIEGNTKAIELYSEATKKLIVGFRDNTEKIKKLEEDYSSFKVSVSQDVIILKNKKST